MEIKISDEILTEDQAWLQKAADIVTANEQLSREVTRLRASVENLTGILKTRDGELEQLKSKQPEVPEHDPEDMLKLLQEFNWVVSNWETYVDRGILTKQLIDVVARFRHYVPKKHSTETPETKPTEENPA